MWEKWKQRAVKMNFKKAVIIFAITGLVLAVAASAALYGNFRGRMAGWEQLAKMDRVYGSDEKENDREDDKSDLGDRYKSGFRDREHDAYFKERKERDHEKIWKEMNLSAGDRALIAGCGIAAMAMGVWYWLLVMIAVYRKARRMGVNPALWTLAALVFNLAAVAALYLYAMLKGTCANCGRVRSGRGKFCDRCGKPLVEKCPQCGQETDAASAYCGNCGKRMDEPDESDEREE